MTSIFPLIIGLFFVTSCGKKINGVPNRFDWNKAVSMYSIESNCMSKPGQNSNIYNEVMNLSQKIIRSGKLSSNGVFTSNYYDYLNPMIVNEEKLKSLEMEIQNELNAEHVSISLYDQLFEYASRFEGMRCQFNFLKSKKKSDLRPYLYFVHECKNKGDQEDCTLNEIEKAYSENYQETKKEFLNLCLSFEKANVCEMQYELNKKQNSTIVLTESYLRRFAKERFNTLFELRNNHQKFNCIKNDDVTIININMANVGWSENVFKDLVQSVEKTWNNKYLKTKVTISASSNPDAIKIIPLDNGISHVLDNDNKRIYLNRNLDYMNLKKVIAHEFGHILGFPDCYIEFFDETRNELVYYELSKNNVNLMCSLKTGSSIPDSYFDQLIQNSCKF